MSSKRSEAEWRELLSPEQFQILRQGGTERAFTGKLWDHKGDGIYRCAGCEAELFDSTTKYDSGSGWPSFYEVAEKGRVELVDDESYGMHRVEVRCASCGGHLGHLFPDGPEPTGQRYCINSASLAFAEREES